MCQASFTTVSPSATSPASTSPAPARMSVAHTGALDKPLPTPDRRVVTVGAGIGAHPHQLVRNRNRASNTFSVMNEWPSATAASASAIGCRSVGKPG